MDFDVELDCGCVVGWNHGAWDYDLTDTDECTEDHDRDDAIDIAEQNERSAS